MASMGSFEVSYRSLLRDESGKFISEVEAGAVRSVTELANQTRDLARVFAPRRRGWLASQIESFIFGTYAETVSSADYAAAQEKGAGPHSIGADGQLLSNRDEGFSARGPVLHPGNPAVRYLARAGQAVAAHGASVIRANMPGM